jgi:RimJ/RimL family protein N-acetyltransferase
MNYVVDFARDLHLKKLLGYVLANNDKMMKLCVKKGFELEKLDEETAKASLTLS